MADSKNDPTQSFSAMVTEWERNFDAFANQVMGTEAYSEAMNEMQKTQLMYQRGFTDMMTKQLAAMNMPSREDIIEIMDSLRRMDHRLERIEDRLALNDGPNQKKARPARTRKPPQASNEGDKK